MSQPTNYRYPSYEQSAPLKGGMPPMINGQPGPAPHTQNGTQIPSFNSAGTPSSQSSRDPSREASRDPSPTQYLHNQYRPQLPRPPMPPINGQPSLLAHNPIAQQAPSAHLLSSPQTNPAIPQSTSSQFIKPQASNSAVFSNPPSIPVTSTSSGQNLSSETQVGSSTPTIPMQTRYDFPSPNRNVSTAPSSLKTTENPSSRASPLTSNPGQNFSSPVTSQSTVQGQSINSSNIWNKETANPGSSTGSMNPGQKFSTPITSPGTIQGQMSNLPPPATSQGAIQGQNFNSSNVWSKETANLVSSTGNMNPGQKLSTPVTSPGATEGQKSSFLPPATTQGTMQGQSFNFSNTSSREITNPGSSTGNVNPGQNFSSPVMPLGATQGQNSQPPVTTQGVIQGQNLNASSIWSKETANSGSYAGNLIPAQNVSSPLTSFSAIQGQNFNSPPAATTQGTIQGQNFTPSNIWNKESANSGSSTGNTNPGQNYSIPLTSPGAIQGQNFNSPPPATTQSALQGQNFNSSNIWSKESTNAGSSTGNTNPGQNVSSPVTSVSAIQGQNSNLPPPATTHSSIEGQNLNPSSNWKKENSIIGSNAPTIPSINPLTNPSRFPTQTWRNPSAEASGSSFTVPSHTIFSQATTQPQLITSSSKDSVPPTGSASVTSQNFGIPGPNANSPLTSSSQTTTSQLFPGTLTQTSSPRFASNTTSAPLPPPLSSSQTSIFGPQSTPGQNSASYIQSQQPAGGIRPNPTNQIRNPQLVPTQAQVSPPVPNMNSSMQNVFGNTQPNQGQHQPSQGQASKIPPLGGAPTSQNPSLPKPQAQYPSAQVTRGIPGNPTYSQVPAPPGPPRINENAFSSENLASQRKYPQATGYPPQTPITSPQGRAGPPPIGVPRVPGGPSLPPPPLGMESQQDYRQAHSGQMSNVPLDNLGKRYPTANYPDSMNQMYSQLGGLSVTQSGYNELWGQQSVDILQHRNILPEDKVEPPRIKLQQEFLESVNCSPDIFRCTLNKIPESNSLLQKCRLPLGILIHPFKDLLYLPVVQCSTIVRCRSCRTYINPFVYFVDSKRWKCNLCYRVNELPQEFQFDPVTKSYGDPSRRPEVKTSTIEFIAPSEYMLRPPQPAVYLFLLDVSRLAVDSGYLGVVCDTIYEELMKLPGDGRTQVGFMAIDSAIHFFSMPENVSQPHELIMLDVEDVFLPCPDNLIVNLKEREELIRDLLEQLPVKFADSHDTNSALGAGLQAAFKLMSATGGRITVFQTCLPNIGPGALQPREDPNSRASKDVPHLNPATDFYKRLALDCSGQQIAVDLFLLNSQYSDLATLSGMSKFSGGCIYHIPLFRRNKPQHGEILERMLRRYITRKIGFEAVMRTRCTRGLSIHTFHGNFFVRSTDLLSLPNVNPDAGFGMQVSIEENLSDVQSICFQAALLYTSSKGERRIRVHTLCLPVSSSLTDILYSADQQAIIGLLSKMAVDRSLQSSLSDAREALINVAIDVLSAYKLAQSVNSGALMAPMNLKLLPLFIIALMKSLAYRSGTSTRLDDRIYAMCQMKALPLCQLMQTVYPDLYPVHNLDDKNCKDVDGRACPQAIRLHLSAEKLDSRGAFLMDAGDRIFLYVGKNIDANWCNNVLGVPAFAMLREELYDLPELDTVENEKLRNFIFSLQEEKPYYAPLQIIRDDSHFKSLFTERLIEDRTESSLSYYEFLQHLKTQVK